MPTRRLLLYPVTEDYFAVEMLAEVNYSENLKYFVSIYCIRYFAIESVHYEFSAVSALGH